MTHRRRSSISFALAVAAASLLLAQPALAKDLIKGGSETFTLNLGGIVNQFNSNFRLDGEVDTGTEIDLEGNGLDDRLSSFMVSGTWRFANRHRVGALYFSVDRGASRTSTQDITIKDQTIPAGSTVSAESETNYLLFDYRYSLYKREAWEFAGVLGFYGGNFGFSVEGPGLVGGTVSASTTVPLPLIGLSADWYVMPRWNISAALAGLKAEIGAVDGSIVVFSAKTDYMFTRNLGVGLSYLYSRIDVEVSKSGFNGNVDFTNNAFLLYTTLKF